MSEKELEKFTILKESLLYGELLPRGANKALSPQRLDAGRASVLFDLGMGTGKIPIQTFLQFPNLQCVYGIELSPARYKAAETAALELVQLLGPEHFNVDCAHGRSICITQTTPRKRSGSTIKSNYSGSVGRQLHLECGNLFTTSRSIESADVIMLETEIPADLYGDLCLLLKKMKPCSRTLTYIDLRQMWTGGQCPFRRHESNKFVSDRYSTSWSVQRGHHFFIWTRVSHPYLKQVCSIDVSPMNFQQTIPCATEDMRVPRCSISGTLSLDFLVETGVIALKRSPSIEESP